MEETSKQETHFVRQEVPTNKDTHDTSTMPVDTFTQPIDTCPKPKVTQQDSLQPGGINSAIYSAVYSGVPVFEMVCKNVAVMRRRSDSYLNATQILKVAGIDKGKRTKILERVIANLLTTGNTSWRA